MSIQTERATESLMSKNEIPSNNRSRSKARVHDLIVFTMGKLIVSGEYKAEISLGNETEIGKTFKASRTATREALKILGSKGLIESKPKIGTIVRSRNHWNILDPMVLNWCLEDPQQTEDMMAEIHEMRLAFEPTGAKLAAQNHSVADIVAMRRALRGMAHYLGNEDKVECDLTFHKAILTATGNSLFIALGEMISVGLKHIFHTGLEATFEEDERWIKRHKLVSDAIEARDGDMAKQQMERLLLEARDIQKSP